MKLIYKIYLWILLSIVVQAIILSYINFIYLDRKAQIVATSFDLPKIIMNSKYKANIPTGALDVKLSYDNSYVGYITNGGLEVLDLSTKQTKKTIKPQNGEITYYKWMPDRDILIYAIKEVKNGVPSARVITYDIISENEKTYPKISINSKSGGEVTQIELSALTNVVYVMVKDGSQGKIYRYNIMEQSSFIMNTGLSTVIKETSFSDNLIYQDKEKNIYVKNGTNYTTKNLRSNAVLLNIANEDVVFIGQLDENNKVGKIFSGKLTEKIDSWATKVLDSSLDVSNIVISNDGKIYVKKNKNSLFDIENNKNINFAGNFIELNLGNISSVDGNKLYLTSIK